MSRPAVMYADPDHASACAENENVRSIAGAKQDKIEAAYFDDAERGISQEWALYDIAASAESLIAMWGILEGREESGEKVAFIREIIRKLMRAAAEHHAEQVMGRGGIVCE